MSRFLYYASWFVILHAVQLLFTGIALWTPIQPNGMGEARAVGLIFLHVVAVVYVLFYLMEERV